MTSPETAQQRRWIALGVLGVAQFMVILDAAIITVALPSIADDLGIAAADLSWVITAYLLPFAGLLLLGGRAGDVLGHRRIFVVGLVLLALASLGGGFAQSETQLIVARAVQGVGAAMISPVALSIVAITFVDGGERNRAMGVWSALGAAGGATGLLLGGLLTETVGWEWVFWFNVPLALGAAALAPVLIAGRSGHGSTRSFDLAGAVTVTAGLTLLVYALVDGEQSGWPAPRTPVLLILAGTALAGFVAIERRAAEPLVPSVALRARSVLGANVTMLLAFAGIFTLFVFLPVYLQRVLGYNALEAGLANVPIAVGIFISSNLAARVASRAGALTTIVAGLALVAVGMGWFARLPTSGTFLAHVLGPELVLAAGVGMTFVGAIVAALSGVADEHAGLASGLISTSQQIGSVLGLAILATVANAVSPDTTPAGLTEGYRAAFLGGAGFALAAAVLAYAIMRERRDAPCHDPTVGP